MYLRIACSYFKTLEASVLKGAALTHCYMHPETRNGRLGQLFEEALSQFPSHFLGCVHNFMKSTSLVSACAE